MTSFAYKNFETISPLERIQKLMCLSNYLSQHPIQKEKLGYRVQYLTAMEVLRRQYAAGDIFAAAFMRQYKKALLNDPETPLTVPDDRELGPLFQDVMGLRFKWFALYSHDFVFMMDALFLLSFDDAIRAHAIFEGLKAFVPRSKQERMDELFAALYHDSPAPSHIGGAEYLIPIWRRNRAFFNKLPKTILITATMSSGKSTVVNAIVGKQVSRTQSEACTAKLHYIINKGTEDGVSSEYDHELILDADLETLMDDNAENASEIISVGTFFRASDGLPHRIQLIDTPGVGSAWHREHQDIAEGAIKTIHYDEIVCVVDGNNLGTGFTMSHLSFLKENQGEHHIIFLINKTDDFRKTEDSIEESMLKVLQDLKKAGFKNYDVYPISARAGYLAKRALYGEELSSDDMEDLSTAVRKYRNDFYDCSKFYPPMDTDMIYNYTCHMTPEQKKNFNVIIKSGLFGLESVLFN